MNLRPALRSLAILLLTCAVVDAQQQPQKRCEVSSVEISAARRLPQVVGDIGLMVRGLQEVRIESQDRMQACSLQKRIDERRAEESKRYEGLADDCMVGNVSAGEIRRQINNPQIHREEQCD